MSPDGLGGEQGQRPGRAWCSQKPGGLPGRGSLVVEGVRADARTVFLPLELLEEKPVRALGQLTAETGP